ncbi:MAG: squalene synthase HpnC [Melioribacteraceae bacterium]|nr:squalene synthase HpnC [Melioribacteraceae bacterium]
MDKIYKETQDLAKRHYENFPVISYFLPKRLRKPVALLYHFSRTADDIADEGNISDEERIIKLHEFIDSFSNCLIGKYDNDFWKALHSTINKYNLTPKYFYDLLNAFEMDCKKKNFNNFDEILYYCQHSANPVGRIMLEFINIRDEKTLKYSDNICTALQLTNFYQDISLDIPKDRIYIPLDELDKFDITVDKFKTKNFNEDLRLLMKFQLKRCSELFNEGKKILLLLPKNFRRQIKMTILGGEEILKKIESQNYNVTDYRPTLRKIDYIKIMIKSIFA